MIPHLMLLTSRVAMEIECFISRIIGSNDLPYVEDFIDWFDSLDDATPNLQAMEILILWGKYRQLKDDLTCDYAPGTFVFLKVEIRDNLFALVNGEKNAETDRSKLEFLRNYMLEISKGFQSEGL
jgi:hypothetical protein